jgi:hypothetical protein
VTTAKGPIQVVSGPMGNERVHFEAPKADRLAGEIAPFLEWFQSKDPIDQVLEAEHSRIPGSQPRTEVLS